ncbi:MAG: hypothetical protein Kow002_01960 [Anaerolineales bacterium]
MNGLIALLGSGEYLPIMDNVDRHLLDSVHANGRSPRVVCLPTAAGQESQASIERWMQMGKTHFQRLGADVQAAPVIDKESANHSRWAALLENADLIYFSGGNPIYLKETLQDSLAWQAACKAWERGAIYAGCSAGAMILAQRIPNFRYAGLKTSAGFKTLPPVFIMPHFDRLRGIFSALLLALRLRLRENQYVLGIDENTALVGSPGQKWKVMGQGQAHCITRKGTQTYSAGESLSL